MPTKNKVFLMGHLGRDPEVKFTKSGDAICSFSLATNDGWGENKKTNWHRIVCFKKTAEYVGEYAKKGTLIDVEGRIDYKEWEDSDGNKKHATEISAFNVAVINIGQQEVQLSNGGNDAEDDDEMPF